MQSLKYINHPSIIERRLYDEATQWMVKQIASYEGVKAFYRFGNITVPGISDLDLLIVFKNKQSCTKNGFELLPEEFKPLFTHRIMAVSEDHFYKNNKYTLWSDHVLLWGKDLEKEINDTKSEQELQALKIQTAVEFLIANYIDLKLQLTYGTVNLRSFLQHMKGIIYDLEFLGISSGPVMSLLQELKHVVQHWFQQKPSVNALNIWIAKFDKVYEEFCNEIFIKHPMYLPPANNSELTAHNSQLTTNISELTAHNSKLKTNISELTAHSSQLIKYNVARNVVLSSGNKLSFHHSGMVLPSFLTGFGKKIMRLQNRFNCFEFIMPITHTASLPIIAERFDFLKEMKAYNKKYLPEFMTITTSITSKII